MLSHTNEIVSSPSPSPKTPKRSIPYITVASPHSTPSAPAANTSNGQGSPAATPAVPATDIIGAIIGDFGIWQIRTVLIIFLCKIPAAWFMACVIFTAPEVYAGTEFQCAEEWTPQSPNQTISENQCYVEVYDGVTTTEKRCENFVYDYGDFYSLVMQFDLVCIWGSIYIAWTQYWHLFGVLLGGIMGTKMMLRWSPRNVYIVGMVAQIFCGCFTAYAKDFTLHCAGRTVSAICCAIMFTAGQAIFADITAGLYRIGVIILYDTFWSVGVILLPGLSSLFHHWTYIYVGITFPTLLLMLLLKWTPDSPRWLLRHAATLEDVQRVDRLVRHGAQINDRTFKIPRDFDQQLQNLCDSLQAAPPPANWLQLWRGPRAVVHMICAHMALALLVVNYMGMLLNLRSFGRDWLVPNTIVMGLSEIVGCFLALHLTLRHDKWKWQWAGVLTIITGAIGCLGWTFSNVDTIDPEIKVILWMVIATIPKAGVSCAQSMLLACMNELMPPNKKQPFVFSAVTWARIWLLSAPFYNVLKVYDVALSLTVYCIFSIIAGTCTSLLKTPRKASLANQSSSAGVQSPVKENALLTNNVWTVEHDEYNTRL